MPFYKCSQECSNFVLHESCARLVPELKNHFQEHTLVLRQSCSLFCCRVFGLPCNGFAYSCEHCIDVHCGIAPTIFTHEAQPNIPYLKLVSQKRRINNHFTCRACHNMILKITSILCHLLWEQESMVIAPDAGSNCYPSSFSSAYSVNLLSIAIVSLLLQNLPSNNL